MDLVENKDYIFLSRKEFMTKYKKQDKMNVVLVRLFDNNNSINLNRTIYIELVNDYDENTKKTVISEIISLHYWNYRSYEVHAIDN